jgi:hypothetical protein
LTKNLFLPFFEEKGVKRVDRVSRIKEVKKTLTLYYLRENLMITIEGKNYLTVEDAATKLGNVSSKTVLSWIKKGVIDEPPKIEQGLRVTDSRHTLSKNVITH